MAEKIQEHEEILRKFEKRSSPRARAVHSFHFHLRHSLWLLIIRTGSAVKRLLDVLLSVYLLALFSPVLFFGSISARLGAGRALCARPCIGRDGRPFSLYQFCMPGLSGGDSEGGGRIEPSGSWLASCSLYQLPVLFNILKGDMSFVGPNPVPVDGAKALPEYAQRSVRPGLTNPYLLRRAVNIAHEGRAVADKEYIHTQSIKGDLGIMARSLLMLILGKKETEESPPEIDILDITIHNHTMQEAVDRIVRLTDEPGLTQLAFVNPDCLNISRQNARYRELLQRLDFVLADGIGIHIACRMLHTALADNVNGTDLFPYLCMAAEEHQIPMFFLGAREGVAEAMVKRLREQYPALPIAGFQHGYFSDAEEDAVIERINRSGAKILLVAFGVPRQELWIDAHKERLSTVRVAMGVGGLFDFMSGRIARAPRWMREIGMEWVYRLVQEPGRMWRRYVIGNPLFLWRVWRWRKHARR